MKWSHLELAGGISLVIGAMIWLPEFYQDWRVERAIRNYDVRETFDVQSVSVGNSVVGERVIMGLDRTIHKPFFGSYAVEVRTFPRREVVCTGPLVVADILYSPEAQLPDPLTLSWWADSPTCRGTDLPAGEYIIVTTWTVQNDEKDVPPQRVTVTSNPFTISAIAAPEAIERLERLERKVAD